MAGGSTDLGNYTVHYVYGNLTVLNAGLVGLSGVSVSGGSIDSFDSSLGSYGSSNRGKAALVLSNGRISLAHAVLLGSVLSTQGSILVASSAKVTGNATAGGAVSGAGHVAGPVKQNAPTPAIAAPTVSTCGPYSPIGRHEWRRLRLLVVHG